PNNLLLFLGTITFGTGDATRTNTRRENLHGLPGGEPEPHAVHHFRDRFANVLRPFPAGVNSERAVKVHAYPAFDFGFHFHSSRKIVSLLNSPRGFMSSAKIGMLKARAYSISAFTPILSSQPGRRRTTSPSMRSR